jgi:hypothetical protein
MARDAFRRLVRPRRGATLVLVAIMSVVIIGLAAFAIDMSRLHVAVNEVQTAADAAALRGAQFLQRNRGGDPTEVTRAFARANNQAFNRSVELAPGDVLPGFWEPGYTDPQVLSAWDNANAVIVRASQSSGLLFGRLLSSTGVSPTRSATAWVANVTGLRCPAPWGFPIAPLNKVLYGIADNTVRTDLYDRLNRRLNDAPFDSLSLTIIYYPVSMSSAPTAPEESWPFWASDENNINMNNYADQVAGGDNCRANYETEVGEIESFPGIGQGAVPRKTVDGAFGSGITGGEALCAKQPPPNTGVNTRADCFPVGFYGLRPLGVTRPVAFIPPPVNGSAEVLSIGGFRVMCVFSGRSNGEVNPSESCDWYTRYRNSPHAPPPPNQLPQSLPTGTLVGIPVIQNLGLDPASTKLGNGSTLAQRLILVH